MAVDVLRRVAGEVGHDRRDLARVARASQRAPQPARQLDAVLLQPIDPGLAHPRRRRGAEDVHPDPVHAELEAQRIAEADDAALRRGVIRDPRAPFDGHTGGDVDDAAAPLLDHMRRGGLDGAERPLQVGLHHGVEVLLRHVPDHVDAGVSRVVDQAVDAPERVDGGPDDVPGTLHRCDGVVGRRGLAALSADERRRLVGHGGAAARAARRRAEVVDHDLRALGGHEQGDGASDAAAGAGDHRDLAVQGVAHGRLLTSPEPPQC